MNDRTRGLRPWQRYVAAMTCAVALGAGAACSATRLESSWVKPDLRPAPLKRVVAIAMTKDSGRRRAMEESLASQLQESTPGIEAVPSYTLINDEEIKNESRLRERFERTNYDGAIMLRVTDVERQDV